MGLNSDPATDHSYCSLDYAWYPEAGGTTHIYENCGHPYSGPTYTANDVFKVYWNPLNNRIEYYIKNELKYTSGNIPSGTYYVDLSLYTAGGSFTNVTVQGGNCQTCAAPVEWTSLSGTTVNGATITKTGGVANQWSSGAYSLHPVTSGGFVQFQAGEQNTYKMLGLNSDPATDHSYCSIDYAWYPYQNGGYQVYENCGNPYNNGTAYNPNDKWMIYWNPVNNRIEYYRNKVLQYTSTNVPSGRYYVDISFYTMGASFNQVVIQGGACSYSKDWF